MADQWLDKDKPTVRYVDVAYTPKVGENARLCALDHPKHPPYTWVWTTMVLNFDDTRIVTLDTIYVPIVPFAFVGEDKEEVNYEVHSVTID
jgi:hypothetical protein